MLDELRLPYEESATSGRHRRRKKRGGGRTVLAFVLIIGLFGLLGGGAWWGYDRVRAFLTAPDYTGGGEGDVTVTVEKRQTATDIANTLYRQGVVKSAQAFVNAAEDDPRSTQIQPGHYKLRKKMAAREALELLLDRGSRLVTKTTIPEGLSMRQTFTRLSKDLNIPVAEFEKAAQQAAANPTSFGIPPEWLVRSDDKQPAISVEGFLFPSTYEFDPGFTAQTVLKRMINEFMQAADQTGLRDGAQDLQISPFEALIVASLIVDEAGIDEDLPKVSRVVYNRLYKQKPPMALQFDSTTNYWFDKQGKPRKDRLTGTENNDKSNPYSTYAHKGLPPGPISSPSMEALAASVKPADGPWLYFVLIDKQGRSAFTDSYTQHQRNIQQCRALKLGC